MYIASLLALQPCSNMCCLQAWQEDSLDTLKLIAHLRDVRGGKGEQKLFHDCVAWMRQQHPLTLIANLQEVVEVSPFSCTDGS